jgi:hypothetical protein
MARLFFRMTQMFQERWKPGDFFDRVTNEITPSGRLWCQELASLTPVQIKSGIEEYERRLERAGCEGKELWSPGYAEFRGVCKNPTGATWEQRRVEIADREREAAKRLPAPGISHADEVAHAHLDHLLGLFGKQSKIRHLEAVPEPVPEPAPRSTRDTSLAEDLYDRSWAE